MPPEHREQLERTFHNLSQMMPEHIKFEILDQEWKFTNGLRWSCSSYLDWMALCDLAERVVSDLQDFMADLKSEWWSMIGRKRLGHRIDCVGGRPELMLLL